MGLILQFISKHPWVFLAILIIISGLIVSVFGQLTIMIRGYNPYKKDNEGHKDV